MPITSLELNGFKRTFLCNIRNLKFTFGSKLQVIIGTNGAGKSSVLEQCSPLPPEPSEFHPGGSKVYRHKEGDNEYVLTSVLRKAFSHSFKKNDEELNPGGTATVQRELCRREFGLTPQIFSVLSGKEKLTTMPLQKRREFFTALAPTDLSYAVEVFKRLKTNHTYTIGAKKHQEKRIAEETAKLLDQREIDLLKEQAALLQSEIETLMLEKETGLRPPSFYSTQLSSLKMRLEQTLENLLSKNLPELGIVGVNHRSAISDCLADTHNQLARAEGQYEQALAEHSKLCEILQELERNAGLSLDTVVAQLGDLRKRLATFSLPGDFEVPESITAALEELQEVKVAIGELLVGFPASTRDFSYDRTAADARSQELASEQALQFQKDNIRDRLVARLEHISHASTETCPNCSTDFVPGVKPGEEARLIAQLEGYDAERTKRAERINELLEYQALQQSYDDGLYQIRRISTGYPRLRGLWTSFADAGFPGRGGHVALAAMERYEGLLIKAKEKWLLETERNRLDEIRIRLEASEGQEVGILTKREQELALHLERLTATLENLRKQRAELQRSVNEYEEIDKLYNVSVEMKQEVERLVDLEIRAWRSQIIGETISAHQLQLATLHKRLSEIRVTEELLVDLKGSLAQLQRDEAALAQLITELSPKEGLIAEQMSGFIAQFTNKMNELISVIWEYDFKVLPCGIEEADLDYRFPLEISDERYSAPDVTCGSEAQCDLVDFVFKLVVALILNRPEWPLYLDELGASFDETHRQKVMQFVRDYVDAGKASSVFLISHYASSHIAMTNAEIAVLDPTNVTLPTHYNEHVVFS